MKYKLPANAEAVRRRFFSVSTTEDQKDRIEEVRKAHEDLAVLIMQNCPPSRSQALALTALEECCSWCVKSIAHEGKE